MFVKEFEEIEIILTSTFQKKVWCEKLGYIPEINVPFKIHWSLLKTTKFRTLTIKVKCDDCGLIHDRRIRDLDVELNTHYCRKCGKIGERNPAFGLLASENAKKGLRDWIEKNGNPFTWESTKQTIKDKNVWLKVAEKTRGQKRTTEMKKRQSDAALNAFKKGTRVPCKRWGKTIIKQYKGIDYQSNYELNFLKYIESIDCLHLIERGPKIEYIDTEGKAHTYFSDYKIKDSNIVFEIKSKYTWNKNLGINLIKKDAAEKLFNYKLVVDNRFRIVYDTLKDGKII